MRYGDPRFGKLFPCDCQAGRARLEAGQRRVLAQLERELGAKLMRCTFDNFDRARPVAPDLVWRKRAYDEELQRDALRNALHHARAFADRPVGWLAFFGPPGSGKSHLSAAIANALAARGESVSYTSAPALMDYLRAGFADNSTTERLKALQEVAILVLDDLGAELRDERTDEWLYKLLNYRAGHDLPTVISSNAGRGELDDRVRDRIDGDALVVHLVCSSYRAIQRQHREELAS